MQTAVALSRALTYAAPTVSLSCPHTFSTLAFNSRSNAWKFADVCSPRMLGITLIRLVNKPANFSESWNVVCPGVVALGSKRNVCRPEKRLRGRAPVQENSEAVLDCRGESGEWRGE